MENNSKYNELRFDREKLQDMTLNEKFAAITGIRIFDINSAIEQASDKQAVIDRLTWLIWGGKQVVDDELFNELREEIQALGENSSSDDSSSSGGSEDSSDSSDDSSDSSGSGEPQSDEMSTADVTSGNSGGLSQNEFDNIDQNGDGVIDVNPVQSGDGTQIVDNNENPVYTGEDND